MRHLFRQKIKQIFEAMFSHYRLPQSVRRQYSLTYQVGLDQEDGVDEEADIKMNRTHSGQQSVVSFSARDSGLEFGRDRMQSDTRQSPPVEAVEIMELRPGRIGSVDRDIEGRNEVEVMRKEVAMMRQQMEQRLDAVGQQMNKQNEDIGSKQDQILMELMAMQTIATQSDVAGDGGDGSMQ